MMRSLEGDWKVERMGGLLPPMIGVRKTIRGGAGETRVGPLPVWPFRAKRTFESVDLVYRRPFSTFVDEVRREPDGSWLGRMTFLGLELGRFRMTPIDHRETSRNERRKQ
jgi:hypothetical protein